MLMLTTTRTYCILCTLILSQTLVFGLLSQNPRALLLQPLINENLSFSSQKSSNDDNGPRVEDQSSWYSVDPNDLTGGQLYSLCISSVVPRPVAVISTRSSSGVVNCAPFSYTGLLSHDPPTVAHGIGLKRGKDGMEKKDTLTNIEETKEWVFNLLTTEYLSEANQCAANFAPGEDETQLVEGTLTTLPCDKVQPPRLEQAAVSMECQLVETKEMKNDDGDHTTTIVIGRVVQFHIRKDVLVPMAEDDDSPPQWIVDLQKLQAVGRAGGVTYWPVGMAEDGTGSLEMKRPQ
ncbi:unnamed protein product [Cylindrotheca closterium]|uniref:Flavin reductase like domain-containing protein n=1 Tax=Cylindrotheca closterium TaxID=2856 RepID=A0AAD2FPS0_9STRA|nr:unnamed protein product [Cylindrotheca closterium]